MALGLGVVGGGVAAWPCMVPLALWGLPLAARGGSPWYQVTSATASVLPKPSGSFLSQLRGDCCLKQALVVAPPRVFQDFWCSLNRKTGQAASEASGGSVTRTHGESACAAAGIRIPEPRPGTRLPLFQPRGARCRSGPSARGGSESVPPTMG